MMRAFVRWSKATIQLTTKIKTFKKIKKLLYCGRIFSIKTNSQLLSKYCYYKVLQKIATNEKLNILHFLEYVFNQI